MALFAAPSLVDRLESLRRPFAAGQKEPHHQTVIVDALGIGSVGSFRVIELIDRTPDNTQRPMKIALRVRP